MIFFVIGIRGSNCREYKIECLHNGWTIFHATLILKIFHDYQAQCGFGNPTRCFFFFSCYFVCWISYDLNCISCLNLCFRNFPIFIGAQTQKIILNFFKQQCCSCNKRGKQSGSCIGSTCQWCGKLNSLFGGTYRCNMM